MILQDEYMQEAGSVVEVDYYNATSLLGLTDEQLIQRTLQTYLAACHPAYGLSQVQDSSVLRSASSCRPSACCHGKVCPNISLSDTCVCLSLCLPSFPTQLCLCYFPYRCCLCAFSCTFPCNCLCACICTFLCTFLCILLCPASAPACMM